MFFLHPSVFKDRIFYAFSFGPFIGFWLAFEAGKKLKALNIPGGGLSSSARLQSIFTHQANVLCCTPTYALRLAEVAKEEGINLNHSPVRSIIVAGEPGGSIKSTRKRIEEAWPKSSVFDHHGMTEVGPVTYQCPNNPGLLHVLENAYLPEIIDVLVKFLKGANASLEGRSGQRRSWVSRKKLEDIRWKGP